MKKKLLFKIILLLVIFPFSVYANNIGDFYKDINVSLNCSKCANNESMNIHLKLFADGKEVEGTEVILNKQNNFTSTFEDIPMFREDGVTEINYEVKFLEDGKYKSFSNSDISYKKERASKWVSVKLEDLSPGKDYVLMTDNWNYSMNGQPPYILLDKQIGHQFVNVYPDYKLVNGKKSYYSIDDEVEDRCIWHFEKISKNDELYNSYPNSWILTSSENKNMVLTGYSFDEGHTYMFKGSSKKGWSDTDNSYNNYRMIFNPIENELSRFMIQSDVIWDSDYVRTRYLGIGHMVEQVAQKEAEYGAHIIAFEHVDNVEVEEVYNVSINRELCNSLEDSRNIVITDNVNILSIFNNIAGIQDIEFKISDPSIIKIENGNIIPLKVGKTDVTFKYGYTDYKLRVSVYELKNPKTANIVILFISLLIVITIIGIKIIRKKEFKI